MLMMIIYWAEAHKLFFKKNFSIVASKETGLE